jgi:hypothetical protein
MLKRLLREPMLHFLGLALLIFAAYWYLNPGDVSSRQRIVVDAGKIEQLSALFGRTWQRPPTAEELAGLVDDYIKEEIYYREARALGLDADDTVIRRRLRLKMEFLNDADAEQLAPTDAELEAYLEAHREPFRIEPAVAFEQIFLSRDNHGPAMAADAATILEALRTGAAGDPSQRGDTTMLPASVALTPHSGIAKDFGEAFADAVIGLPEGAWSGPVESTFGVHLVKVGAKTPARMPKLAEVRDEVLREWRNGKRKEVEARRLAEFHERYDIVIEPPGAADTRAAGAKP